MTEILKPGEEEHVNWEAPKNAILKNSEEEVRLANENQEKERNRLKKAFEAFNLELGASPTMFYELTSEERDEMMQKMLDIYKYYQYRAYQNVNNNKRKGIEYMNFRPK